MLGFKKVGSENGATSDSSEDPSLAFSLLYKCDSAASGDAIALVSIDANLNARFDMRHLSQPSTRSIGDRDMHKQLQGVTSCISCD